jgi:hypothetical protein
VQDWKCVDYEALCKHDFDQAARHGDTEDITMSPALQAEFTRKTDPNEPSWSKWSPEECKRGGKKGGTASVEKARESKPRSSYHVMKGTGDRAENDLQQRTSEAGSASAKVRSQNQVLLKTEAWAKTAEASGLGAGRFEGYNLGYTGGFDQAADKDAIVEAATQPEVVSLSRSKKKLAVARALNINSKDRTYTRKTGAFKRKFDEVFPPTTK